MAAMPTGYTDGCTGFPDRIFNWDWSACCVIHDAGGSDGALLDCITSSGPTWAAGLIAVCVTIMVIFRPIYEWMQRRGWVAGMQNPNDCYCEAQGSPFLDHNPKCAYAIKERLPPYHTTPEV